MANERQKQALKKSVDKERAAQTSAGSWAGTPTRKIKGSNAVKGYRAAVLRQQERLKKAKGAGSKVMK